MPTLTVGAWIAIGTLALSAGAAYVQHVQANKSIRDQKKAESTEQAEQSAQAAQKRKMEVRQERIRRAQIISASANTGTLGSSGSLGAQSAVGSLVEGNIGAINRNEYSADAISAFSQDAANHAGKAQTWGAIKSLAGETSSLFASTPSTQKSLDKLFS